MYIYPSKEGGSEVQILVRERAVGGVHADRPAGMDKHWFGLQQFELAEF
jgi:hypothetical protein